MVRRDLHAPSNLPEQHNFGVIFALPKRAQTVLVTHKLVQNDVLQTKTVALAFSVTKTAPLTRRFSRQSSSFAYHSKSPSALANPVASNAVYASRVT